MKAKRKEILKLSERLIKVKSVSSNYKGLKAVLAEVEKEVDKFFVKSFSKSKSPSLLVYSSASLPKKFKVILNAHLDVVPGRPQQFKPKVNKGRLYGRGAYDMKAAAAVEILVFKELAKKLPYPIGLQLVTDEEVGGFAGTKHQIEKGVRADFVIAGEPTDLEINNAAKGIIWAKVYATGVSAHGAYPWLGENAILIINKFLDELLKIYPVPRSEVWSTTVNVASIQTENTSYNTVPDKAFVLLDIRYIPDDKEKVLEDLKSLAKNYKLDLEIVLKEPEHFTPKTDPNIFLLQKATTKIRGRKSRIVVKHGGSDIRHYNAVGCEGITFGPVGAGHHTEEEWVDIQSLEDFYLILKEYLLSL